MATIMQGSAIERTSEVKDCVSSLWLKSVS